MILETAYIKDLKNPELVLVVDSQDVECVKDLTGEASQDFDSFFVRIADGDFAEVWGFSGIIPYLWYPVFRIK